MAEAWQSPGQWYLDRTNGELGYIPLPCEEPDKTQVIAPRTERLVRFQGRSEQGEFVEHVTLHGLNLAHAAWNLPAQGYSSFQAEVNLGAAVQEANARHCALEQCVVRHTGAHGLWWGPGCHDCRTVSCELYDVGAGGILIGSSRFNEESDEKKWAGGCLVRDNLIAHIGRIHPGGAGIWIGHAANNVVENNEVQDTYYSAISVGWRWSAGASAAHHNTIDANYLHDIGQGVLIDMAGVYTLGESPGTVVRGNRIDHVRRARYGGWGIYFDESSAEIVAEKNLAYDTQDAPFHLHYGRDLTVRNNIFALGQNDQIKLTNMGKAGSLLMERNIFYWDSGQLFKGAPDEEIAFRKNLYWQAGATSPIEFADGKSLDEWRQAREPDAIVADPRFADPASGDFRLPADSPASQIGFEMLDVNRAGRVTKSSRTAGLPPAPGTFPPAPPEPPFRLRQDFELLAVDQAMPAFGQMAASRENNAHVTDETAAGGKHGLKFTDDATGAVYFPHLYRYLDRHYEAGVWRSAMDLRIERGAQSAFDWRDADPWYANGPSFEVTADGTLKSNGQALLKIPHGQWLHVELTCGLGEQSTGKYQIAVTLPGEDKPQQFERELSEKFHKLGWLGFSSLAYEPSVYPAVMHIIRGNFRVN